MILYLPRAEDPGDSGMDNDGSSPTGLAPLDVSSLTLEYLDSMTEEALKTALTKLLQNQPETTLHTTHTNHTSHGVIVVVEPPERPIDVERPEQGPPPE
jgi:hypothetical protein